MVFAPVVRAKRSVARDFPKRRAGPAKVPAGPMAPFRSDQPTFTSPAAPPNSAAFDFVKKTIAKTESEGIADRLQGGAIKGTVLRDKAGMFAGGVGLYQFDVPSGSFGSYLTTLNMGLLGFDKMRTGQLRSGAKPHDAELDRIREFMRTPEGIESQDRYFKRAYYDDAERELAELGIPVDQRSLLYMTDILTQRGHTNYASEVKRHYTGDNTIQGLIRAELKGLEARGDSGAANMLARRLETADKANIRIEASLFEDAFNKFDAARRKRGKPSHASIARGRKFLKKIRDPLRGLRRFDALSTLGDQP